MPKQVTLIFQCAQTGYEVRNKHVCSESGVVLSCRFAELEGSMDDLCYALDRSHGSVK